MAQFFDHIWEKWRKRASLVFMVISFACGMMHTIFYPTEFLYLKTYVQSESTVLYYSLSTGGNFVSALVFGLLATFCHLRQFTSPTIILYLISVAILGSVLYVLTFSIWFVVVGNVFMGAASGLRITISAELSRMFHRAELTQNVFASATCFLLGMTTAPCLAFAYMHVKQRTGKWFLVYGNMPAVIMASLWIATWVLAFFFVRQLASILDHGRSSDHMEKPLDAVDDSDDGGTPSDESTDPDVDRYLLSNSKPNVSFFEFVVALGDCFKNNSSRTVLLTITALSFSHQLVMLAMVTNGSGLLRWGVSNLVILRTITTMTGILTSSVLGAIHVYVSDYAILLGSIIGTILQWVSMLGLSYKIYSASVTAALLYCNGALVGILDFAHHAVSRSLALKLFPATVFDVAEATRFVGVYVGCIMASCSLLLLDAYAKVTSYVVIGVNCLILALLCFNMYLRRSNRLAKT